MPESECKTNKHYKDVQTIKVNTSKTEYGVAFSVKGGNFLAAIGAATTKGVTPGNSVPLHHAATKRFPMPWNLSAMPFATISRNSG